MYYDDDIHNELFDRGLLPVGHVGYGAQRFMDEAGTPDVDRYRGALLGGACGEALGWPVRNMRPRKIRQQYGQLREFQP